MIKKLSLRSSDPQGNAIHGFLVEEINSSMHPQRISREKWPTQMGDCIRKWLKYLLLFLKYKMFSARHIFARNMGYRLVFKNKLGLKEKSFM